MSDAIEAERKRAIAAIHWVFNADGTVGERAMAQEAIHKINDPTFMPALTAYEAAKSGGVGVAALLDAYDAETSKLPLGHETPSHGRSTFNWRRAVVAELRDLSATLALTSPASGSGQPRSEAELEALPAHPLAAWRTGLPLGLHRVHWTSGGSSLCAVGMQSDGRRWIAPCNWVAPSLDPESDSWAEIERTELLFAYPEPSPASGSGTREEIKGAVGRETEGWPAETDHVPSPASGERDAPAGYVLAPVEPTPEMLRAGMDDLGWWVEPYEAPRESGVPIDSDMSAEDAAVINAQQIEVVASCYRAMLAAALRMEGK